MDNITQLAMQIIFCLLIAALLGAFIGYLIGKMSKCDKKNGYDYDTDKYRDNIKKHNKKYSSVEASIKEENSGISTAQAAAAVAGAGAIGAGMLNSAKGSLPDVDIKTPELNIDTPDVNLDADIPKVDLGIEKPELNIDTPNIDVDVPDVDIKTPELNIDTPDVNLDASLPDAQEIISDGIDKAKVTVVGAVAGAGAVGAGMLNDAKENIDGIEDEVSNESDKHIGRIEDTIDSKVDNLKEVEGIGIKTEKYLNSLGICTFEQVSSLSDEEIQNIENELSIHGRIKNDSWLRQAKLLAAGIETEFSKKVRSGHNQNY
jgi:predicted flap endonuclease-1-like 5' DNA nuclease